MINKYLALVLSCFALSGCSTPGYEEHKALCEKDAGEWYAYKEPIYVDGLFIYSKGEDNPEHYFWEISSGGYDYVEVYKEKLGKTNTFKEVGYYKLYKAPKGDPNCGHDFQWKIDRKTSALRPFGINHCVAFKKI